MENITAKVSCFARAYHYKNSASTIFADTAAEALLGQDYDRIAESMTQGVGFFLPGFNSSPEEGLRLIVDRQLSPSVLGRSAYCERMLENEIRLGCRQYVIFASGYDTFAIRNSNAALSVYEIGFLSIHCTSLYKVRLRRSYDSSPHLRYIPVPFPHKGGR